MMDGKTWSEPHVQVYAAKVTPDLLWDSRDDTFTYAAASSESVSRLSPEKRALICGIVRRSLEYASTRVEDWILDSLSFEADDEGKDRIVVKLEIQHSDIDDSMNALSYYYKDKVTKILSQIESADIDA